MRIRAVGMMPIEYNWANPSTEFRFSIVLKKSRLGSPKKTLTLHKSESLQWDGIEAEGRYGTERKYFSNAKVGIEKK